MTAMTGSASGQSALLEVQALATGYGDLRVVWDVSLTVRSGMVTALLGRNGAGKTTTLRAIAGLNRVHSGRITYQGADITHAPVHRRVRQGIAVVQDNKRIFHRLTVTENLLLGGYSRRMGRRRTLSQIPRVFDIFPVLARYAGTYAGQLSGGQQQMVAIGQALMAEPRLLILDEPSAGLAPAIVTEVMATVSELKGHGLGILLVEQAMDAALRVADDFVVLDVGRVALEQQPSAGSDLTSLRAAYFGLAAK